MVVTLHPEKRRKRSAFENEGVIIFTKGEIKGEIEKEGGGNE